MLRIAILVGLLSACGGSGSTGPAWPKSSNDGPDGGESLAPRVVSPLAANESKDDDKDDDDDDDKDDDDKSSTKDDDKDDDDKSETSKGTSATVTAPEEVINLDDLVIEVDDD